MAQPPTSFVPIKLFYDLVESLGIVKGGQLQQDKIEHIKALPPDVLRIIFGMLSINDLVKVQRVNRRFRVVAGGMLKGDTAIKKLSKTLNEYEGKKANEIINKIIFPKINKPFIKAAGVNIQFIVNKNDNNKIKYEDFNKSKHNQNTPGLVTIRIEQDIADDFGNPQIIQPSNLDPITRNFATRICQEASKLLPELNEQRRRERRR